MDRAGAGLLPFFLVIDVSWSMSLNGKLDSANRVLPAIVRAVEGDPVVSARVRFCLIDFADDARVQLPLCDLVATRPELPTLKARSGTSYASAFTVLRQEIAAGLIRLHAEGATVDPPVVFFLSDGAPTDDEEAWRSAFARLTEQPDSLRFVPCGLDDAEANVMATLIHPATGPREMALYMMQPGYEAAEVIGGVADLLVSSMVRSSHDPASAAVLPDSSPPQGITRYDAGHFR